MATPARDDESGRVSGYPAVPTETWWRLRKQFKAKGAPKPWDEDYLVNIGVRGSTLSARNVVRPFKRLGFFTEDGKPTDRYWDWLDDAKYKDTCQSILREAYPSSVVNTFTSTDDDERKRLMAWFQRNQGVNPNVARQYAAFYLLLLKGDVSEQDETTAPKSSTPLVRKATSRTRKRDAIASNVTSVASDAPAGETLGMPESSTNQHQRPESRRAVHSIEPSLNINIQIHIPAEASTQQIDQIFESMGRHLYRRQEEAGE